MQKSSEHFIPPQALTLIRRFEGLALTPYLCPAKVWTVGYGHVLNAEQKELIKTAITPMQAEMWLEQDA